MSATEAPAARSLEAAVTAAWRPERGLRDPRLALLAGALAALLLMLLRPDAAAVLAALALAAALARGGGRRLAALVAATGAFTLILNAFTEPGVALWRAGPLALTRQGLAAGAERAARLAGFLALGWLAARGGGLERLADLAARLALPLERRLLRLEGLGLVLGLAVRFVPEVGPEIERLRLARLARPPRRRGGIRGRVAAAEPLFLPLLAATVRRAEEVACTLDARGYGTGTRTQRAPAPFGRRERALAAALVAGAALLLLIDRLR